MVFTSWTPSEGQRPSLGLSIDCRVHYIVGPREIGLTACRWHALAFPVPWSWPFSTAHEAWAGWSPSAKHEHPIPLIPSGPLAEGSLVAIYGFPDFSRLSGQRSSFRARLPLNIKAHSSCLVLSGFQLPVSIRFALRMVSFQLQSIFIFGKRNAKEIKIM